jgi:hypothetical protein
VTPTTNSTTVNSSLAAAINSENSNANIPTDIDDVIIKANIKTK